MLIRLLILSQARAFPVLALAWDEQHVLDMLLASSPVLRAYKVVTREYTPSTPMQQVFEGTFVFARGLAVRDREHPGGACSVGTRYLAMGMGDKTLYIMAVMTAALFMSLRFFLFKGAGRAS